MIYDRAERIKTILDAVTALDGIPVVVDKQADLAATFAKATGAAGKGAMIAIGFNGGTVPNPEKTGPRLEINFAVSIWAKPQLRRGQTAADVALEAVITALHHAEHDPASPTRKHKRFQVVAVDQVASQTWFSYIVTVNSPVDL